MGEHGEDKTMSTTMRAPRLLLPLLTLALLGSALLVFTGLRLASEDDRRLETELRGLARQPLEGHARSIAGLLSDRVPQLIALTEGFPTAPDEIRSALRKGVWFRHALVADVRGRVVFPPADARSASEVELLERTRPAWARGLNAIAPPDEAETRPDGPVRSWHWRTWYWGPGLHVAFVRALPDGRTVLVELDRARLLADVIERLPSEREAGGGSAGETNAPAGAHGRLVDVAGAALYLWGQPPSESEPALAPTEDRLDVALPAPLANWHLQQTLGRRPGDGRHVGLWAGLGAALVALLGGLLFIHRESTRTVREALQRVTFVNQVSHELKTPLTNIRMYAEMLEDELDLTGEAVAARHLGIVVAESQRLSRLIGNILTFARSQRSALSLHLQASVPDDIVRAVLEGFAPALEAKRIVVALDLAASEPRRMDADAAGQILGNLIGNVEKYAAAGHALRIESRFESDRVVFRVADAGPGIPEGSRERVFQPFERLDDRLTEGVSGTGIGLTIARELARLHGGDVSLLPRETGACFEVILKSEAV